MSAKSKVQAALPREERDQPKSENPTIAPVNRSRFADKFFDMRDQPMGIDSGGKLNLVNEEDP